jgi:translocation and assembly module TamA
MRFFASTWVSLFNTHKWAAAILRAVCARGHAAELNDRVSGLEDPLLENVQSHLTAFSIESRSDVSEDEFDRILAAAIRKAEVALHPYGYYHPDVTGRVVSTVEGKATVELLVSLGPPIIIDQVKVQLTGAGAERSVLKKWRDSWPLVKGEILDQTVWEERKEFALDEAKKVGYLAAEFVEHRLELDLKTNRASASLTLDTGQRFVFGDIDFGEHILRPGIVEYIPRFEHGDPYNRHVLDKFRIDLWKTGNFTDVVVQEIPRADVVPPVVDLRVRLATLTRNTYQGSVGVGSDTGARIQAQWGRHPLSSKGDSLAVGAGWQNKDQEYSLRGSYRLPRRKRAREYWTSDLIIKHENLNLDVRRSPDEDFIRIASGIVDERHLRAGRLHVRNFKSGEQQALETLFVQVLNSSDEFRPLEFVPDLDKLDDSSESPELLKGTDKTLSFGFDYDLVAVTGKAWDTKGHRERAWIFASSELLGSDRDFRQAYVSSRRSYLKGERWKFLIRTELGYSDAKVFLENIDVDGNPLSLSVTSLPNFYRFKAGGSNSVRGYGFEELSDNHIGSNNILTASAEIELKFRENWSAAVFFDIGNAFNDWSNPELKKGAGVGLRWYSIAGAIRVDVAQALDLQGSPWRLHFTIGTPLL